VSDTYYSFHWYVDEDYMPFKEREKAEIKALTKYLKDNKRKWVCVYEGDDFRAYRYFVDLTHEILLGRGTAFTSRYERETESSTSIDEPAHRVMMRQK
jgi:hypothetical protein